MHPRAPRRVHSLELKRAVIAECRQAGASVSAVALAHGLNANLVRKWLLGRGSGRDGVAICGATPRVESEGAQAAAPMRFVPVALAGVELAGADDGARAAARMPNAGADIHIELRRGSAQLTVRWPSLQAQGCTAWLGELTGAVLK